MTITLTPEQLKWIEQQVAGGKFESVEDAVRLAVAELMTTETDDLVWAKPLVDEARASLARGKRVSADSLKADLDAHLKSIGAR
jgi:antitoxin ParD1/3/4